MQSQTPNCDKLSQLVSVNAVFSMLKKKNILNKLIKVKYLMFYRGLKSWED